MRVHFWLFLVIMVPAALWAQTAKPAEAKDPNEPDAISYKGVNIIVVPAGDASLAALWSTLGDGFAADAHIEVHKATDVLKVPSGAAFREGSGFAVFAIEDGHARLTKVGVGSRSPDDVEVTSGLAAGARVVVHPSDKLKDGAVVTIE